MAKKRLAINLTVLLVTLTLCLFLAEGALRLLGYKPLTVLKMATRW